jgi:hypothetical protein
MAKSGFSLDVPHNNIIPHPDNLKYASRNVSDPTARTQRAGLEKSSVV